MKPLCLAGFLLTVLFMSGCHGTGETMKLQIRHVESAVDSSKGAPLTVAVSPFDDQRQSSEHLGTRTHGNATTYFDVMDGTLSKGVTSSFVDFLNQAGFQATPANGAGSTDIRIEPTIQRFKVRAIDKPLSTFFEVDATLAFAIHNSADNTIVRIAVGAGGTDHDVFFKKEDMETLIGEVLSEGFEEFLEKVEVRGQALKFHFPEESS